MRGLLFVFLFIATAAFADVSDLRFWPEPDGSTSVFIDLTDAVQYKAFTLPSPARVVVDIEKTSIKKDLNRLSLTNSPFKAIRSARRNGQDLRVVFELKEDMQHKIVLSKPNEKYGYRLVISFKSKGVKPAQQAVLSAPATPVKKANEISEQRRNIIIAIDAGHGGEDPGAIGPNRLHEKNVVFAIAKELEVLLQKEPGYTPYMVRKGDYYLGLRERNENARKAQADFFISIHADAFKNPRASGSSVFTLSSRGASSETANWLADKENQSDLIGGYDLQSAEDHLALTLLDLSMTNKQKESDELAQHILNELGRFTKLHKNHVEQAGFVVLKAAMPALLVETGFISNPKEAKQLSSKAHQQKVAQAILQGIKAYCEKNPPEGTLIASKKAGKPIVYFVKKGDSLTGVAKRYQSSLPALRELNNLKTDRLFVGQQLLIPSS